MQENIFSHVPVLPEECITGLAIKPDGIYLDATTGGGGHSRLIAERLTKGLLICMDRDGDALQAAKRSLEDYLDKTVFIHSNFEDIATGDMAQYAGRLDGMLFDLGVSSYQLDTPQRGFSYMKDAPLDMRMDREQRFSAYDIVNGYEESELKRIISLYGEERYAHSIAAAICRARTAGPIETTAQLVETITGAMPAKAKREKQHPAKRSFQAIRMEVNGELPAIEKGITAGIDMLRSGGRIAVISFHSLEDRVVKTAFADKARGCTCPKSAPVCICGKKPELKLINKKVILPQDEEIETNPRSRSAKLRIAEKLAADAIAQQ